MIHPTPIIGITAEWNPFHSGHADMLRTLRDMFGNSSFIAAMSGSFVQRGEPVLFDKWSRARTAVENGMDAVFELPTVWVLQSADRFAAAGVMLLAGLGATHIAFSTESLSAEELMEAAAWSLSDAYRTKLKGFLAEGASYAEASHEALAAYSGKTAEELTKPNNLLGLKYVETIRSHNFLLTPIAIHRDMEHNISASDARQQLLSAGKSSLLPACQQEEAAKYMQSGKYTDFPRYEDACLLASRQLTLTQLSGSGLFSEGLEHKWEKETQRTTYEEMLSAIKSKRYLYSRLKRIGACLLLGGGCPSPFAAPPAPSYGRLLALRKEKSSILRRARLPLITSTARALKTLPREASQMLTMDLRATDVAAWCRKGTPFRGGKEDFYHSPEVIGK